MFRIRFLLFVFLVLACFALTEPMVAGHTTLMSNRNYASHAMSSTSKSEVFNVAPAGTPWPMFHRNLNHTGVTPDIVTPPLNRLWTYTTGFSVDTSPAVSGGVVYVGSNDDGVYALRAASGALIWGYLTGYLIESTSPAVSGGILYIGSDDGNLYALNASTGAFVWSYDTGYLILSSPAVSGGVVYVGSYDDKVYALNAATGAFIWSYTTGGHVYSSPAVSGGVVYVGSYDDKVYALNAATGAFIWSYTTGGPVHSSPAVSGGVVYVGSYDDKVYALNAATGAIIWSYATGTGIDSSPAVSSGIVYIGSNDDKLYALNAATGAFIWSYTTGAPVYDSPAVSGGVVYVGSFDHTFYALDANTGSSIWSYTTGNEVRSSPAISGGVVYVGSDDNKVYAFAPSKVMMTVSYQVTGDGSGYSAPVFNYVQGGIGKQLTLTTLPIMVSVDFRTSWSVTNPLQGSTATVRWWTSQLTKGASSIQTINFVYLHQYRLTMGINPSSGGSVTPSNSWQNSSASVNIQATPNSNFAFLSWVGSGTGSYSGTNNPATLTMNGPITETASFQQTTGQLSINLDSPRNGAAIVTSPVTFKAKVTGFLQDATVTIFLDGSQVCSGSTDSTGSYSCKLAMTKTGLSHSWYATASKSGFTSGTSPTWTFTY